jgi:hypothetical protein
VAEPDTLYIANEGSSDGMISRWNVATGEPRLVAITRESKQEFIHGLAVSADGKRLIPASSYPLDFEELDAASLAPDGIIYPGGPGEEQPPGAPPREAIPSAVAVSGAKTNLIATGLCDAGEANLHVATLGNPTPIFEATTPESTHGNCVARHGLALSEAGHLLFALNLRSKEIGPQETVFNTFQIP